MLLAVCTRATVETVALNHALKALTLTDTTYLHAITSFKLLKITCHISFMAYLLKSHEVSLLDLGFIDPRFFLDTVSNLRGNISISLKRLGLGNSDRQNPDNSHWCYSTLIVEDLGHI